VAGGSAAFGHADLGKGKGAKRRGQLQRGEALCARQKRTAQRASDSTVRTVANHLLPLVNPANRAPSCNVRYIIKAGQAHVAACEFIFHRLALKPGLRTARVRLVEVEKADEFKYPACAVDYITNATKLPYGEWKEIGKCRILTDLSFTLGDRDNMDFLRDENGVIYKTDHSDCFGIESVAETWLNPSKTNLSYLFYQMSRSRPTVGFSIKEYAGDMPARIARMRVSDFDVELGLIEVHYGKPFEEHFRYYIDELINQCKQI